LTEKTSTWQVIHNKTAMLFGRFFATPAPLLSRRKNHRTGKKALKKLWKRAICGLAFNLVDGRYGLSQGDAETMG